MARLTRAQARDLRMALHAAASAQAYLNRPSTIIAMQKGALTTTVDFTLPDGRIACEVEKFIGSPLAMLVTATQELERFLCANT